MIARVLGVIAVTTLVKSILRVMGSTSTNTGVAPTLKMTLDVATQEIGVVITSSPAPMPASCKAIFMVAVPLAKQRTGRPPKYALKADSNSASLGPEVTQPERKTSATASIVS